MVRGEFASWGDSGGEFGLWAVQGAAAQRSRVAHTSLLHAWRTQARGPQAASPGGLHLGISLVSLVSSKVALQWALALILVDPERTHSLALGPPSSLPGGHLPSCAALPEALHGSLSFMSHSRLPRDSYQSRKFGLQIGEPKPAWLISKRGLALASLGRSNLCDVVSFIRGGLPRPLLTLSLAGPSPSLGPFPHL